MTITGTCLCGAVGFEVSGGWNAVGHCHCSMCRKSHGAAFATWGLIEPDQFRWTSGEEQVTRYSSSEGRERLFCSRCGSPMAASHGGRVSEVVLGVLDGEPGVRPQGHIFVGSKAVWHEITDPLPQHDTWPPGVAP